MPAAIWLEIKHRLIVARFLLYFLHYRKASDFRRCVTQVTMYLQETNHVASFLAIRIDALD
jgi:hypothetical protein